MLEEVKAVVAGVTLIAPFTWFKASASIAVVSEESIILSLRLLTCYLDVR